MTYVFDIDGTICSKTDGDYTQAQPLPERIEKVNRLYDEGHTVILLTARGMGRSNNSVNFAYESFYDLTHSQLKEWGVKFHELFLGKPAADHYIDDKGVNDEDFFDTGN
jgi:hydroxymethylpyrimidine pyrophosphatase-like HAD family hydrolase